jgi:hypothetical protein
MRSYNITSPQIGLHVDSNNATKEATKTSILRSVIGRILAISLTGLAIIAFPATIVAIAIGSTINKGNIVASAISYLDSGFVKSGTSEYNNLPYSCLMVKDSAGETVVTRILFSKAGDKNYEESIEDLHKEIFPALSPDQIDAIFSQKTGPSQSTIYERLEVLIKERKSASSLSGKERNETIALVNLLFKCPPNVLAKAERSIENLIEIPDDDIGSAIQGFL